MEQEIITSKKKKWYRRKVFYILVIVGFVLAGIVYSKINSSNRGSNYETAKVERGSLKQTVDATGNIESADELDLRFETNGRIGQIYKQVNEEVKAGDIIIDLQLGELNARISQASASVQNAQANLDKVLAGETDSYVANLRAKLDQAKANLEKIKASSADTVADARAALETAENNLKLSEGGENSTIVQETYDDMVTLLLSVQTTMANALTEADNILGIDNTLANDEFESVLSINSPSVLARAETNYRNARDKKSEADEWINSIELSSEHGDIDSAGQVTEEALLAIKDLMFEVSEALDNTFPVGDLSQSELSTLKSGIATERAAVNADYVSLINQTQAIQTSQNSYSTNLVAYNKAKSNLENAELQAQADINAYQALVDQAQANYDDVVNPPREEDVASARAQLNEAYGSLSQAVANRNKARIVAPIDGMIGKIDGKVGEYVAATDTVVKLVSPHFEVKVDIPETDIIKVSKNDEAEIVLDAFGDDIKFTGKVTEIEIGETVIQDVVYYTVTVSLEGDETHEILNGMTADVVFDTEKKENVLYIPQRAVRTNDEGGRYVRLLENDQIREVEVTLGLRGDDGLMEVVSGLEEGQEVIIREVTE